MADTPLDPNMDERAARMAELKRKMQERAKQVKAETAPVAKPTEAEQPAALAEARPAPAALAEDAPAAPAAAAAAVDAPPATSPTPATVTEVAAESRPAAATVTETVPAAPPRANGASAPAAPAAQPAYTGDYVEPEEDPATREQRMMNRREFLTYTWAAALGLVGLQAGVGTFMFMYPRFRAGEFGGEFFLGPVAALPSTDAPPLANSAGKFWLVNTTDEGVKAIYMVCTHLGCLYKWEPSTVRFECPCHGSKFSREGYYIEGPAPRSLDTFAVREENGEVIVDTGAKTLGPPASQSPAAATA